MQALALVLLSPLLALQGLWVVLRAERLPEAAGPRQGQIGNGPPLRVLLTGDSSAAGVGAALQEQALAGQLSRALSGQFSVSWEVIAKSGATTASTDLMIQAEGKNTYDIAVIALGVNDSKNGMSAAAWEQNYKRLINRLRSTCEVTRVYVCGLPEVHNFPLLPVPLRRVLGKRARRFDAILQSIAAADRDVIYVPMDIPFDVAKMASDGFHPAPVAYALWGDRIALEVI
ncbi:MAG: SGNH/GDSL hydrolase family protein, partial [Sulfitobacter sp.]